MTDSDGARSLCAQEQPEATNATETCPSKAAILRGREKPPAHPIDAASIPADLKIHARWLLWIWEQNASGKWTKPPVSARTGRKCDVTNPASWCTFEEAMAAVQGSAADGVGFALGQAGDIWFVGVDQDNCRNVETGELTELAQEIIATVDTYSEVSPTSTGAKSLCTMSSPPDGPTKNREGTVEIYSRGRYFTITSRHLPGTPCRIEARQEELMSVWRNYLKPTATVPSRPSKTASATSVPVDDPIASAALAAMLRNVPDPGEDDGSKRLFICACRAVEHDLSDPAAVSTVRAYAETHPFPKDWTEAEILKRVHDAERHAQRGSAFRSIDTSNRNLAIITPLAWKAIQLANEPPKLFRYAGEAARIESGDDGEPVMKLLDSNMMRHHLARAAEWIKWEKRDGIFIAKKIEPPVPVVNDVLATPNYPLPILSRIVEAPVFAADGTLQTAPGYHSASHTFYVPADGFSVPDVSEQPDAGEIESARALICDELLGDFPFVGAPELAHAVSLLLLPFARDLMAGPTPLHLLEKPSPGTGATLLVDMLSFPAVGRSIPAMTEGRDEDEWRKRITAKLRDGTSYILIDNLQRKLDSAAVSAGITATTWEDRILGASDIVKLPVRCAWMATGNNPAVSTEIARRTVRIRMDAKMDRPWLRDEFRHSNLREWAVANRGQLVWAALTLIRGWLVAGKPAGKVKLGMYEKWSEVMGGILAFANVPGFLGNLSEFYDESDAEGAAWRAFIAAWWERCETRETPVKDLRDLVSEEACLPLGGGNEHSQKVVLGKMLADRRDRVFDLDDEPGRVVLRSCGKKQGANRWHLAIPTLAV